MSDRRLTGLAPFRRHLNASGSKPGKVRFWCRERGDRIARSSVARRSVSPSWAISRSTGWRSRWGSLMSRCVTGSSRSRRGSLSRWAPAVTRTTPSPKRSSRPSRKSSSTVARGLSGSSCKPRCSNTSRRSTTSNDATRRSTCSHPLTTTTTLTAARLRSIARTTTINNDNPMSRKPGHVHRPDDRSRGGRSSRHRRPTACALLGCVRMHNLRRRLPAPDRHNRTSFRPALTRKHKANERSDSDRSTGWQRALPFAACGADAAGAESWRIDWQRPFWRSRVVAGWAPTATAAAARIWANSRAR